MQRKIILQESILRIASVWKKIVPTISSATAAGPLTDDQKYLIQQSDKLLRPVFGPKAVQNAHADLIRRMEEVRDFFVNGSIEERLAKWYDGTGQRAPLILSRSERTVDKIKSKLSCMFYIVAYAPEGLQGEDDRLVMRTRSFMLPRRTFEGVMVHEATHRVLGTLDTRYDKPGFGHSRLKDMEPRDRLENADNWRIFHQKMDAYFYKNFEYSFSEDEPE